ncbi:MAG: T9SS type A sorting domain-containing protein [Bacteroidia bacterium]
MFRSALFTLFLPISLWSQSVIDESRFPPINDSYGGVNISSVFFGFISAQRGDTCTDSSQTIYGAVSFDNSGIQQTISDYSCHTSYIEALTESSYCYALASAGSGMSGMVRGTFENDGNATAKGTLKAHWDYGANKVTLDLTAAELIADRQGIAASTLSVVVWEADEDEDTVFEVSDIIWQSTATLKDDQIFLTGAFQPAHFLLQSYADSMVGFAGGLHFIVDIPAGVDMRDVMAQIDGRIYRIEAIEAPGTLGLSDEQKETIQIYPNPATDHLTIVFDEAAKGKITLMDIKGQSIRTIHFLPNSSMVKLNVDDLRPGIYLLLWRSNSKVIIRRMSIIRTSP